MQHQQFDGLAPGTRLSATRKCMPMRTSNGIALRLEAKRAAVKAISGHHTLKCLPATLNPCAGYVRKRRTNQFLEEILPAPHFYLHLTPAAANTVEQKTVLLRAAIKSLNEHYILYRHIHIPYDYTVNMTCVNTEMLGCLPGVAHVSPIGARFLRNGHCCKNITIHTAFDSFSRS